MLAGIDLGGTRTKLALGRSDGELVDLVVLETQREAPPGEVVAGWSRRLRAMAGGRSLAAAGVGCPGLVRREAGEVVRFPNLDASWDGFPLARRLGEALDAPCFLLNDARCAALAELRWGVGTTLPSPSFVVFTLGTGVGGGVVVDGRLVPGSHGAAGELGHLPAEPGGARCSCGLRGCLETVAGGAALSAAARRLAATDPGSPLARVLADAGEVTPEALGLLAAEGDPACGALIARAGEALGRVAALVVTVLAPQRIVVSGGVAGLGDRLLRPMRTALRESVSLVPVDDLEISLSTLGARAGVLGALALAADAGDV